LSETSHWLAHIHTIDTVKIDRRCHSRWVFRVRNICNGSQFSTVSTGRLRQAGRRTIGSSGCLGVVDPEIKLNCPVIVIRPVLRARSTQIRPLEVSIAKDKIKWFAPRWSFAPRLWRQMNTVVSADALTRIVVCSLVIAVPLVVGLRMAMPQVALPPIWKLLLILPGVILYLVFYLSVLTVIPQRVIIRPEKIVIEHAQQLTLTSTAIRKIWLTVHRESKIRLKIAYLANGHSRTRTLGVGMHVDLGKLSGLLPQPPIVRDARNRRIGYPESTEPAKAPKR